jgi:hypothetical protein
MTSALEASVSTEFFEPERSRVVQPATHVQKNVDSKGLGWCLQDETYDALVSGSVPLERVRYIIISTELSEQCACGAKSPYGVVEVSKTTREPKTEPETKKKRRIIIDLTNE